MSILGLGAEVDRVGSESKRGGYLLEEVEEEEPSSSWRGYAALCILAVAIGVLAWNWQSYAGSDARSRRAAARPSPSAPAASAENTPQTSLTPEAAASTVAEGPASKEQPAAASAKPSASIEPVEPPTTEATPEIEKIAPPHVNNAAARSASPRSSASAPAIALSGDPQLYAEGEKYLYGNGVERDCDRAEKDLRTAAGHAFSPAESLLGTMYASGHCVGRDLPMAYRWYARALHHEPANNRIQTDLQVLWNQMTPAERQAAQR